MRNATQEDLDRLEVLLAGLRKLPGLRERKRGYFSKGSRAFLHFHADAGDLYVDVKLDSKFQRMRVTSRNEQADFLSRVHEALQLSSHDTTVDRACSNAMLRAPMVSATQQSFRIRRHKSRTAGTASRSWS